MPPLTLFHIDCNFANLREDYLCGWLRRLAAQGYTGILWELEDKIQWETCPSCVDAEAMSKARFREILDEAAGLGLESIPLLQTIGHAEYVLKHQPDLSWRENPAHNDCYCTSNPQVRAFLKQWVGEYLDLFGERLRYFHLGGDEAYDFATCEVCRAAAARIGRNGLYAEHIDDLAAPIRARGVRPGIWCDMVLHHPDRMDAIPADVVIWDWNYWDGVDAPERVRLWGKGNLLPEQLDAATRQALPEALDEQGRPRPFYTSDFLRRSGRDVIVCSASRSAGDSAFCGRQGVHAPNVAGAARKAAASGLLGSLVTSWAIRLHNLETQAPWILLGARAAAQPATPYDQLLTEVADELWGLPDAAIFAALDAIGTPLPFTVSQELGIQWNGRKDPEPAPPGYLRQLIQRWRIDDDGARFEAQRRRLAEGLPRVRDGLATLHRLTAEATRGFDSLEAWSRAGHHQLWFGRLAAGILAHAADETVELAPLIALLEQLKAEYRGWAATWLTPANADLTANLVHDALLDYLRKA